MGIITLLIVIGAIIGLFVLVGGLGAFGSARSERLSGEQRAELKQLRKFKQDVRILAARNSDVNPELSTQIQGLLYDIETKELG